MGVVRFVVTATLSLSFLIASLLGYRYYDVQETLRAKPLEGAAKVQALRASELSCEKHTELCAPPIHGRPSPVIMRAGRWTRSAMDVELLHIQPGSDLVSRVWGHATLKQWNYVSVTTPRYYAAAALVKFAYVADVFLYVVDRADNHRYYSYTGRMPLGWGMKIAQSPAVGCSTWGTPLPDMDAGAKGGRPWIEMCAPKPGSGVYQLRASVPMDGSETGRLRMDVTMEGPGVDALVLAFPIGGDPHRLQYIHKGAGQAVSKGWIQVNDGPRVDAVEGGSCGIDWTMGHPLMRTAWRWVSLNDAKARVRFDETGETKEERLGINLSEEVYDLASRDGDVVSAENAVWLNGAVVTLTNPVRIIMPAKREDRAKKPWLIKSTKPTQFEAVDLEFTPKGVREDHSDFQVVVSDFIQPYGTFKGTIRVRHPGMIGVVTVTVSDSAFGVVEDHLAVW